MNNVIKINPKDDVCVALTNLKKGTEITILSEKLTVFSDVPSGHKIALRDIKSGEPVKKYGEVIGFASADIKKGEHVHCHNIKTALSEEKDYVFEPVSSGLDETSPISDLPDSFMGYVRKNGKVGIRNEIWIIPTVGCVTGIAQKLCRLSNETPVSGVDSTVTFTHPYGCSQMGDDQENTRKILADMIAHPNAGGVLVLGLGCENSNINVLKPYLSDIDEERVKFLVCQESEDEISDGLRILQELKERASKDKREKVSVSELIIGMKCGGSDGLSGITANPLVGNISDLIIKNGGSTLLSEVPEMFGAEQLLMNRASSENVFKKTVKLINNFKAYFTSHNQTIYENPSPGNKQGGISTLEDKSLGCTQKSGTALVSEVLEYGDRLQKKGLNLLSAPGNDIVAGTALCAAGAQIVLFTTGRGTPLELAAPTIKISSNTPLSEKKENWIDFNAGTILETSDVNEITKELYRLIINTANGQKTHSEENGYRDFAIFKNGVTL